MNAPTVIDQHNDEEWQPLPLFPWLAATEPVFRSGSRLPFSDEFLNEIVSSTPLQRLRGVGFLGALDYILASNGKSDHRRRHNRFDHSIGVAKLAEHYANIKGLSESERRVFVAAGLLHDVGHGPLSHTLEPIFKQYYGINHHTAGNEILKGNTPLGADIVRIMNSYRVPLDEVCSMLDGTHNSPHSFLFSSPINLDTIEGITRTSRFVSKKYTLPPAHRLIELIAKSESLPEQELDAFWMLKNRVYNMFIHTNVGLLFDGVAQAYMERQIDQFSPKDFLKTEAQLRHKQPLLFHLFAWARTSTSRAHARIAALSGELLNHKLNVPIRTFSIQTDVRLNEHLNLWHRYRQTKMKRSATLESILITARHKGEA